MTDNNGYVLSPLPVAPVNETDMVLLPDGLKALNRVAKMVGVDLRGAYLNLDAGFASTHNRKYMFNAGMIPNITENPRNRKRPKRGRKRFFNAAMNWLQVLGPCTASVLLMHGVLSKPVCVRKMSLSAGLTWGGHRFPQLRMAVCRCNAPVETHDH